MEEIHPDWKSLPAEILHFVFQQIVEERPRVKKYDFAYVCKSWLHPAQSALYSKVSILKAEQLRKFHRTVQHNHHLGSIVRFLGLFVYTPLEVQKTLKVEIFDILTALFCTYLPSLEEFHDYTLESYVPTLAALTDSHLKQLKRLNMPFSVKDNTEFTNYILCVFLMKDRLENVMVSSNYQFEIQQSLLNRLYNELHRFRKLSTLYLDINSNEKVSIIEDIVKCCKSLKNLTCYFRPANNTSSIVNSAAIDAILDFTPATNIKSLTTRVEWPNDEKLLLYMMRKFSQLDYFSLKVKDIVPAQVMGLEMVQKLLKCLSNIDSFSVSDIRVDNTIFGNIGTYWETTSNPGSKRAEFTYVKNNSAALQTVLGLCKKNRSSIDTTCFKYYASTFSWNYMHNFILRCGKFVREMKLSFEMDSMEYIANDILKYIFHNCPNLQHLHVQKRKLGLVCSYSDADFSKRLSLHELYIDNCELYTGLLEHWSLFLPKVTCLRLHKTTYHPTESQLIYKGNPPNDPFFQIAMPSTKIGSIVFENDYSNENMSLKVFALTDGVYYYYRYDPFDNGKISTISATEYKNTTNSKRIFICCLTKPTIHFKSKSLLAI